MYCTKCGQKCADDASFCTSCGQPLQHTMPEAPGDESEAKRSPSVDEQNAEPNGGSPAEAPADATTELLAEVSEPHVGKPALTPTSEPQVGKPALTPAAPRGTARPVAIVGVVGAIAVALATGIYLGVMAGNAPGAASGAASGGFLAPFPDDGQAQAAPDAATVLRSYADGLDVKDCTIDQVVRYRNKKNEYPCEWFLGGGVEEEAVLGRRMGDFDADGDPELLVVRRRGESIAIEMYENDNGKAVLCSTISDYASPFPVYGKGSLDVLCDPSGGVDVQWWYHTTLFGDGHVWEVDRYTYDGSSFNKVGTASLEGTAAPASDLDRIKMEVSSLGLSTDGLEGFPAKPMFAGPDSMLSSMLADRDDALDIVVRLTAKDDGEISYETFYSSMQNAGEQWVDGPKVGTVTVTHPNGTDIEVAIAFDSSSGEASPSALGNPIAQIESQAKHSVVYTTNEDFDSDGSKESLVITGMPNNTYVTERGPWKEAELWFVGSDGNASFVAGSETFTLMLALNDPISVTSGGKTYTFLNAELTALGSGSTAKVFGVRDGHGTEIEFDVSHLDTVRLDSASGAVVGFDSVFDNGHKWQKYGFEFDPSSYSFRSTGKIGEPSFDR